MAEGDPQCRSLTAGLKHARHTAQGPLDYMQNVNQVLNRRRCSFGISLGFIGLPLSALISGAINVDRCPKQPLVEVWMIVVGAVSLLLIMLGVVQAILYIKGHDSDGRGSPVLTILNLIGILFLFAWLIAGSVWVFSIWDPTMIGSNSNYCDGNYWYAFALVLLGYIITAVVGVYCAYIGLSKKPDYLK